MGTGENLEGLRKILDFTRLGSLLILMIHGYLFGYGFFAQLGWTHDWGDQGLSLLLKVGIFGNKVHTLALSFSLLLISLLGAKGKKSVGLKLGWVVFFGVVGTLLFFLSEWIVVGVFPNNWIVLGYLWMVFIGWISVMVAGTRLSRYLWGGWDNAIFNSLNETFPQEDRLLENEYSVNLPTQYRLGKKLKAGWLNIINPFRAILVTGTPGSGKSYFVIRHIITQHISKGFTMFIYDFKYDDLSRIAYNSLRKNIVNYPSKPGFFTINFDDLTHSHRCNPLEPSTMFDITDASESSRTIMLGLNREWIRKQGDFFVESPINFVTAVIWFLKKYRNGKYCTLPHVIEMMQVDMTGSFQC